MSIQKFPTSKYILGACYVTTSGFGVLGFRDQGFRGSGFRLLLVFGVWSLV